MGRALEPVYGDLERGTRVALAPHIEGDVSH